MRARLTQGSKYCTSTNLAPWRYALAAIARTMSSLPGSQETATIWPGCTFAPNPTITSAKRSRVTSSMWPDFTQTDAKCAVSLKERSSQRPPGRITSRVSDPLSAWMNANGRLSVAWRQTSPITPPCTIAATVTPGPAAAATASIPARTRAANGSIVSAPGITSQRSSTTACTAIGSPSARRTRNSPPSHSPSGTSRSSGTTTGSRPSTVASGAAV